MVATVAGARMARDTIGARGGGSIGPARVGVKTVIAGTYGEIVGRPK